MAQTNKVNVRGNLTKDPEFYTLENGKTSCTFTIAVNDNYEKDGQKVEDPSFFTVKTYGDAAEKMKEAKKGMEYTASGMVKQRSWEKDGQKASTIEILAFDVSPAEKGKDSFKQSAYVEFAGNLAADPEFTTTESGKKKCSFTIINNNEYEKNGKKIKDNTPLVVELWNEAADKMKDAKKGNFYKMEGFLKHRWEKDGVKHAAIKLQAIEAVKLEKKIEKKAPEYEMGR